MTETPSEPAPHGTATGTAERRRTIEFRDALAGTGSERIGLNTFQGTFRPTVLTILGVMMYLRLGWVVGEAGLLGALAVICTIFAITVPTALSLSSITTNVRLGAGGVFELISQSLGLETGGAIGIPLYLAQALSVGLYLYGFTETWLHIFPDHPQWAVLGGVFLAVALTVSFSQRLAFRLQGIVLIVGMVSLTTIALGLPMFETASVTSMQDPQWWGNFESGDYWYVFAVFFPAGTGIMVGAGMSGALKDPRRSIPRGTMAAVTVAFIVYVSLAVWYGVMATPTELRSDYLIVVERAAFGPIVLAGILASTFTAALSSMVTAPRVLQALGAHRILPRGELVADSLRNASLATALLVALVLMLGSLDRVAVLITMFFLLTYLIVNVVVLIEQSLGMVSFRPSFRIPIVIPLFGAGATAVAIFIISPTFALVAIAMIIAIYVWLLNRDLDTPWETVRSSIFVSLVDWASRRIDVGPDHHNERSWKPDLFVPVTSGAQLDGNFRFLRAMTSPKGSLQVVGVGPPDGSTKHALRDLWETTDEFREEGLYATSTVLLSDDLVVGARQCCAVLAGSPFRPNVLYTLAHNHSEEVLRGLVDVSIEHQIGAAFLELHPEAGLGRERTINVWVRDQSPDWHLGLRLANLDLAILFAFQVSRNWGAEIRMVTVISNPEDVTMANAYLAQLIDDARLPSTTERHVIEGNFTGSLEHAPHADLHIMGLPPRINKAFMEQIAMSTGASILFVRDSGHESALA